MDGTAAATVSEVNIYPVKSCRGISVPSAKLSSTGEYKTTPPSFFLLHVPPVRASGAEDGIRSAGRLKEFCNLERSSFLKAKLRLHLELWTEEIVQKSARILNPGKAMIRKKN